MATLKSEQSGSRAPKLEIRIPGDLAPWLHWRHAKPPRPGTLRICSLILPTTCKFETLSSTWQALKKMRWTIGLSRPALLNTLVACALRRAYQRLFSTRMRLARSHV